MVHLRLIVIAVFCTQSILAKRCHLADEACMTKAAGAAYQIFMKGIENVVGPSDPLVLDSINADSPDLAYKLQNAKLTGLKDCATTSLILNESERTFKYVLECPNVELNGKYTLSGKVGGVAAEGTGSLKMTAGVLILKFNGANNKRKDSNGIDHTSVKSYTLDIDDKGTLTYELSNLKENSDAIQKYFNDNWKSPELILPIETLIKLFIDNMNKFLDVIPTDQVFAELS